MKNNYPSTRKPAAKKECPYCKKFFPGRGLVAHLAAVHRVKLVSNNPVILPSNNSVIPSNNSVILPSNNSVIPSNNLVRYVVDRWGNKVIGTCVQCKKDYFPELWPDSEVIYWKDGRDEVRKGPKYFIFCSQKCMDESREEFLAFQREVKSYTQQL